MLGMLRIANVADVVGVEDALLIQGSSETQGDTTTSSSSSGGGGGGGGVSEVVATLEAWPSFFPSDMTSSNAK